MKNMNKKRIYELAAFFYSSNTTNEVPLRISIESGMAGRSLTKQEFVDLMDLLENSENLKEHLDNFWEENYYSGI